MSRVSHAERRTRRQRIAAYVADGHTVAEAAFEFGCVLATVRNSCVENGVLPPRARGPAVATLPVLASLLNSQDDVREIAERHGVSFQWVADVLQRARRAGIKFPRRPRRVSA